MRCRVAKPTPALQASWLWLQPRSARAAAARAEETTPEGLARRAFLNEVLASLNRWKQRSFTINAFHWIRRWSHPIVPNRAPFWALLPGQGGSSKRIYFFDYGAVSWTEYEEGRWEKAKQNFRDGIEAARDGGVDVILIYTKRGGSRGPRKRSK
jgi:hypothetical protein